MAFDERRRTWRPVAETGWEHEQFAVHVWRSVRKTGDTKTVKPRRSLLLPQRYVEVLHAHKPEQDRGRAADVSRHGNDLVFCTENSIPLSAENVRRDFRKVLHRAGLVGTNCGPRDSCGTASCP